MVSPLRTTLITLALLLPVNLFSQQATGTQPVAAPAPTPAAASEPALSLPPSEGIGDVMMARGRYLAAIRVFEQLPPTAPILNKTGIACEHMLMFDRARSSFEAALKINPGYAEAYNNMGTLFHSLGDLGRAEKMYKKALKLKPHAANTLQNLGALYYTQRKYKKGDAAYKEALAIDPQILEHSAHTGIQTTSKADAASELHYHMAMTYAQAGSRAMALDYLRKAIGEGFNDRNRLLHDKEFADLRTTDVFLKMVDDLKKN
ncbi:tetratricopeptide repeat protein [Terriglobus roseus]|uniref:Tetratricopeptide repeat-containing protein n=1 Tax=Terriglobus roseus TaxID=392734 RepID=A0A1H4PTY3_9BACT|nr:tetratricopeptide repeat protein [Terriglobus roseus]SEC10698.1 Tetratricopeptide repeat-containing protein [Terriglobus roseus]